MTLCEAAPLLQETLLQHRAASVPSSVRLRKTDVLRTGWRRQSISWCRGFRPGAPTSKTSQAQQRAHPIAVNPLACVVHWAGGEAAAKARRTAAPAAARGSRRLRVTHKCALPSKRRMGTPLGPRLQHRTYTDEQQLGEASHPSASRARPTLRTDRYVCLRGAALSALGARATSTHDTARAAVGDGVALRRWQHPRQPWRCPCCVMVLSG